MILSSVTGFIIGNDIIPLAWTEHVSYLADLHTVQELMRFEDKDESYDIYQDEYNIKLTGYAIGHIKYFVYQDSIKYYGMKYYIEKIKDKLLEYAEDRKLPCEFEYYDKDILELYPLLFSQYEVK